MSLGTLMLLVTAFALGFVGRNVADGLQPFYMGLTLPKSTDAVNVGEVLSIEALNESFINREVTVLADGIINLPLIGAVDVTDQSPSQIQATLVKKYSKYLKSPMIEVYRTSGSRGR